MAGPANSVYVALLRGINVGGRNPVPMAALREVCSAAGCAAVETYIQSGNVVLESPLGVGKLRAGLESAIAERFGAKPAVMIRTAAEMAAVVERNPYPGDRAAFVHVAFLPTPPKDAARAALSAVEGEPDRLTLDGREVYLFLPGGMGRAHLPVAMERCLRPMPVTVRNWRTVTRLAALAAGRQPGQAATG